MRGYLIGSAVGAQIAAGATFLAGALISSGALSVTAGLFAIAVALEGRRS